MNEIQDLLLIKAELLSESEQEKLYNKIGQAYFYTDVQKSLYYYKQALKISFSKKANVMDPLRKIIDNRLDLLHDRLDLLSWENAENELLIAKSGNRYRLDLDKLGVSEIDSLELEPCEFELLKRLCLKDDYSFEHSLKVFVLSLKIADVLKCSETEKKILSKASILHDVGKASYDFEKEQDVVDDCILKAYKQGEVTKAEYQILKTHVEYGVNDLIDSYKWAGIHQEDVVSLISKHHERIDGTGYPLKLKIHTDDILPQILAFVDTIEAMTAKEREYQRVFTFEEITSIFRQKLTGKFSKDILALIFNSDIRHFLENEANDLSSYVDDIFIH